MCVLFQSESLRRFLFSWNAGELMEYIVGWRWLYASFGQK